MITPISHPSYTIHSHYNIIDSIPYAVFITGNVYFFISSPFSPISPTPLPSGSHQFVLCI